jgi:hypothetical protein
MDGFDQRRSVSVVDSSNGPNGITAEVRFGLTKCFRALIGLRMKARRRVVVFKRDVEARTAHTEASVDEAFQKWIVHELQLGRRGAECLVGGVDHGFRIR